VAVVGDGSALMTVFDLATAVRERLTLVAIVFNDGYLNQIRYQQHGNSGYSHGVTLPAVDFSLIAQAIGASYLRLDAGPVPNLPELMRDGQVTIVDAAVTDSLAARSQTLQSRAKDGLRSAIGPRLLALLKRFRRS